MNWESMVGSDLVSIPCSPEISRLRQGGLEEAREVCSGAVTAGEDAHVKMHLARFTV